MSCHVVSINTVIDRLIALYIHLLAPPRAEKIKYTVYQINIINYNIIALHNNSFFRWTNNSKYCSFVHVWLYWEEIFLLNTLIHEQMNELLNNSFWNITWQNTSCSASTHDLFNIADPFFTNINETMHNMEKGKEASKYRITSTQPFFCSTTSISEKSVGECRQARIKMKFFRNILILFPGIQLKYVSAMCSRTDATIDSWALPLMSIRSCNISKVCWYKLRCLSRMLRICDSKMDEGE